jgi:BlaI family transcriptional regulator, penicillinase repressor
MASLPRPTEAELSILSALWRGSPATVREVMERVNAQRDSPLAYTTVLKFMQIMYEKGLVTRDESERTHSYCPAVPPEQTKKQITADLLDRVFGGSVSQLVLQALGGRRKLSATEAAEIKRLIDQNSRPK